MREARWWARVGVLASLALVLGYAETFIPFPVPVPGIKLGLGNIVVLAALVLLDAKAAAVVAVVKVLAAGFLFGNPLMMLYSAGGTALAFAGMAAFSRIRGLSVVLVAMVGAILHNVGQLAVAAAILGTPLVWYSAPVLVVAACITGGITGVAARSVIACLGGTTGMAEKEGSSVPARREMPGSATVADAAGSKMTRAYASPSKPVSPSGARRSSMPRSVHAFVSGIDARAKLAFLAVFMVATLHARSPWDVAACLAFACALAVVTRVRPGTVRAVLVPLAPVLLFTVTMQVLGEQDGTVVFTVAGLAVTAEALWQSARMVGCLLALMIASISFMQVTRAEELVSTLEWLLRPLRAAGVHTEAFILALSVALGFLPVLVGEFNRLKTAQVARLARFDGTMRDRLRAYTRLFAPLLRSSFEHADNLAAALLARGFACGVNPTRLHVGAFGVPEASCLVLAGVFATALALL